LLFGSRPVGGSGAHPWQHGVPIKKHKNLVEEVENPLQSLQNCQTSWQVVRNTKHSMSSFGP